MTSLGTYNSLSSCTEQAHYPCSYSNQLNFSFNFLGFYSYLPLAVPYPTGVGAAAKISAGGVGSPYNQFYTSTNYSSKDISCGINIVWNKPLITHVGSDMARYFTRLYFHSGLWLMKIN